MEASLHRFVRLLRLRDVRISVPETLDALRCAAEPGILTDRATLKEALRLALVKDHRDDAAFDEIFDAFFALVRVGEDDHGHGHGHSHDDLSDTGELESFTLSEEPSETPQQGHEHGKPSDIRDYFDAEDLAQQYNLHQEANKIDLASMTDEIVFSTDNTVTGDAGYRVQLDTDRLHGAGVPGRLSRETGTKVDAALSIAEQDALLGWLDQADDAGDEDDAARLRRRLAGVLENLPQALKRHLEALLELENKVVESRERRAAKVDQAGEGERAELEESLRRLASTLRGALTHRRRIASAGRVDPGRTMRRNMRFDGIPFSPVTVRRAEDRPRLVVLADVSLSVRATARFTLHLVHGLQNIFAQVRSFAFVDGIAETTELFAEYPVERALGLIFGGDVVDVDANSDYGTAFGELLAEHSSAITRRTTVLVLGDGRGNGNDPNLTAFAEISRRAREVIWLTPEPRYSWGLGGCDLPAYSEYCGRVRVVRDLSGLDRMALDLVAR
ncbi:VWA domain-containing protein [Amycolatopsis acidicola]|uniref:VWA domain-containing protein n=1 Tax=Amycolatopsis acidicola TaxID=2596893 RepID=A0A5N0VN46_9PSEU|nr:VWA domain-containing protein [Amycolatopsis acidicola]KAA9166071.1 VWA domain-containing protein [Amycolatopsis acidicola]